MISKEEAARRLNGDMYYYDIDDLKVLHGEIVVRDEYRIRTLSQSLPLTCLIDAGANIGITSLMFRHHFPDAKIIAIEPGAVQYEMYLKNTRGDGKIFSYNYAVGPEGRCGVAEKGMGAYITADGTIPCHPLEWFVHLYRDIDLSTTYLKVDIEGAEQYLCTKESWGIVEKCAVVAIELHLASTYAMDTRYNPSIRKPFHWLADNILDPIRKTHVIISECTNHGVIPFVALRKDLMPEGSVW